MRAKKFLLSVALGCFVQTTFANPVLDNVAAGTAEVHSAGSHVQITQHTPQAILNWQSFNIGAAESVHFQQPANGIALNRVNPMQGASEIAGRLSATGKLIIINPAGIHFHGTAQVDVAGLVATTGNISDKNFLAGNYYFEDNSGLDGSVTNAGKINASEHGFVAFMAPHVKNTGHITAHLDQIDLNSTRKFTLKFGHDGLVHFTVDDHLIKEGVRDKKFIANNGHVLVPSSTAKSVLDKAIHIPENTEARSVYVEDGKIILSAQMETPKIIDDYMANSHQSLTNKKIKSAPIESVVSNPVDSDFEIINKSELQTDLTRTISTHQNDTDWELIDSPRQGANAANTLGTDWEIIDSPRLSISVPNDEATSFIFSPKTAETNFHYGLEIDSPNLSPYSADSFSPRYIGDSVNINPLSLSSSLVKEKEETSPHVISPPVLLSSKSFDDIATYLGDNPEYLNDLWSPTSASAKTSTLSIETNLDAFSDNLQSPISSPLSANSIDNDYVDLWTSNLSDSYDSDLEEVMTPSPSKFYKARMSKLNYDLPESSSISTMLAVTPKSSNPLSLTHFTLLNNVSVSKQEIVSTHSSPKIFTFSNVTSSINTNLTPVIINHSLQKTPITVLSLAQHLKHSIDKTIIMPAITAYQLAKYKFDASYLLYQREKNEIFSENFLGDYTIRMPELIVR